MKYRSMFRCYYCESEDVAGFVCSECEVNKCEECVSRNETQEAICVECLQNSSLFSKHFMIQIVASLNPGPGKRIVYIQGSDLEGAFDQALQILHRLQPGTHSEILLRVDKHL